MFRNDDDSLFWRVERALAECMVKVATTHADGGGQVVVLCNRKLTADQEGRLSFAGVKVVSTKGKYYLRYSPPPSPPLDTPLSMDATCEGRVEMFRLERWRALNGAEYRYWVPIR